MYKNERRGPLHQFNFIVGIIAKDFFKFLDKFFKNEIYFMNN